MRANLASLVEEFRRHAAETAVVAHRGNRRYATTYGELAEWAGRFAAELERRGIAPGERVVLWGENSAEWIGVFFGCLLRGVIVVPLDAAGTAEFAGRVIQDTSPRLIVGDAHLLKELGEDATSAAKADRIRATDGTAEAVPLSKARGSESALPTLDDEAVKDGAPEFSTSNQQPAAGNILVLPGIAEHLPVEPLFAVSEAVHRDTPFQIVFTSGTTAEPRGIVHTHRNILVTLEPIEHEMAKYRRYERIFHPLRFLHSLPLSHVFGQFMGLWCPALLAAEVHFAEQLEPARSIDLIRRERISVLVAVPRVLHLLRASLMARFPELAAEASVARSPLSVDRSSEPPDRQAVTKNGERTTNNGPRAPSGVVAVLRRWWRFRRVHRALGWKFWAVISGGATLAAELEAFWNGLGYALIQGYGMTETAALVTLNHPFHIAPGTIGKTMPGREVKLTDEGEILVRGEMLSGATWSGGAMHAREGEWLATGDLAARGETGELRFLGRKGNVIVTGGGMNIHPGDLEAALAAQPGVRACAVVPCDLPAGTEPVAVAIFAGTDAELDAAVAAANRGLAEFQQIRRVLRWPELQLPYTSTGKLIRRRVVQWACRALSVVRSPLFVDRSTTAAQPQDDSALLGLIAEVTGEPAPDAVDPNALRLSEDLHLDSLGRVQLQSALEQQFDVELEDDAVAEIATVGELRKLVEGGTASSQYSATSAQGDVVRSTLSVVRSSGNPDEPAPAATDDRQRTTENGERRAHVYPHWPWSWPVRMVRVAFLELAMRPLVWLLAKPRVTYVGSLERRTANLEPCLFICNHITAYDGALVLYALPGRLRRRVAAAMSGEMLLDFRHARGQGNWALNLLAPGAYWLLTALFNVFPLPNGRGFRRSFAHAGEAMDHGYSVLIFPEGTRSLVGRMNPFRPGIGLLAQQSAVPIVPVALLGLYEFSPADANAATPKWFHAGRIEIRVGAPIPVSDQPEDPAELTALLEQAVRALSVRTE